MNSNFNQQKRSSKDLHSHRFLCSIYRSRVSSGAIIEPQCKIDAAMMNTLAKMAHCLMMAILSIQMRSLSNVALKESHGAVVALKAIFLGGKWLLCHVVSVLPERLWEEITHSFSLIICFHCFSAAVNTKTLPSVTTQSTSSQ